MPNSKKNPSKSVNRKSLKAPRTRAYHSQNGRCYYCGKPMCQTNTDVLSYAKSHKMTMAQARQMQCTGEHLHPHGQGGSAKKSNIVAACWFCNKVRHRAKTVLKPEDYKKHVSRRLKKGAWNSVN